MAQSDNFNFTYDIVDTETGNITTVTNVTMSHDTDSTTILSRASNPIKGDGYYGRSDGFHTVQISEIGFFGRFEIQGTLAINPGEADWFTINLGTGNMSVDTTGLLREQNVTYVDFESFETSSTKIYNFTGNYVWVRAKVSNWTDGTVNSIKLNH